MFCAFAERVAVLVDLHAKKNEILKINEEIQAIKASYVTSEDRFKTEYVSSLL